MNGSLEAGALVLSSIIEKAITQFDVIDMVGDPKVLKWALYIGEGGRLLSLSWFFGAILDPLENGLGERSKEGQEF